MSLLEKSLISVWRRRGYISSKRLAFLNIDNNHNIHGPPSISGNQDHVKNNPQIKKNLFQTSEIPEHE